MPRGETQREPQLEIQREAQGEPLGKPQAPQNKPRVTPRVSPRRMGVHCSTETPRVLRIEAYLAHMCTVGRLEGGAFPWVPGIRNPLGPKLWPQGSS